MKHTIYVLAIIGLLFGCKKTEYVSKFDELPQERIKKDIQQIKTSLTGNASGWIGVMPTLTGGGYGFYINFAADESLMMQADLDTNMALTANKSYYRIKQDMGVDLVFDTYNYISLLNDPTPSAFGGAVRDGYKSDVEFTFDFANGDTLSFLGKKYRQRLNLTKATAAQKTKYDNGGYKALMKSIYNFFIDNGNAYIEVGANKVGVVVNSSNSMSSGKRVELSSLLTDGSVVASKQKFAYTIDGITILDGGVNILGVNFVRFAWKDATTLAMYDSQNKEYIIKNNATPLLPLYKLWGSKYSGFWSDYKDIYPGTSNAGRDTLNYFHLNMENSFNGFWFNYAYLDMEWNVVNNRLSVSGFSSQNGGSSGWITSGTLVYTVDANGVYTFTVQTGLAGGYVSKSMAKIWNFFLNNQVSFDYYVDGADVYAKVSSVNDPTTVMTFQMY